MEAASRPLQKSTQKAKEPNTEGSEEKKPNKRKRNKRKKSAGAPKMSDVPKDALEQEDEVHEGIDWSDDED